MQRQFRDNFSPQNMIERHFSHSIFQNAILEEDDGHFKRSFSAINSSLKQKVRRMCTILNQNKYFFYCRALFYKKY